MLLNNGLNFVVYLFGIIFSNLLDLDRVLLGCRIIDLRVRQLFVALEVGVVVYDLLGELRLWSGVADHGLVLRI